MALAGGGFPVLAFLQDDVSRRLSEALLEQLAARPTPVFAAGGAVAGATALPVLHGLDADAELLPMLSACGRSKAVRGHRDLIRSSAVVAEGDADDLKEEESNQEAARQRGRLQAPLLAVSLPLCSTCFQVRLIRAMAGKARWANRRVTATSDSEYHPASCSRFSVPSVWPCQRTGMFSTLSQPSDQISS